MKCYFANYLAELFAPFLACPRAFSQTRCWRGKICQIEGKILLFATL